MKPQLWMTPFGVSCVLAFASCAHFVTEPDRSLDTKPVVASNKSVLPAGRITKATKSPPKARSTKIMTPSHNTTMSESQAHEPFWMSEQKTEPLCLRDPETSNPSLLAWLAPTETSPTRKSVKLLKPLPPKYESPTRSQKVALVKLEQLYVSTNSLNVRLAPQPNAPVVGVLKRGSSFRVTVVNGWAKINEGQYVLAKYLTAKNPEGVVKARSGRRLAMKE